MHRSPPYLFPQHKAAAAACCAWPQHAHLPQGPCRPRHAHLQYPCHHIHRPALLQLQGACRAHQHKALQYGKGVCVWGGGRWEGSATRGLWADETAHIAAMHPHRRSPLPSKPKKPRLQQHKQVSTAALLPLQPQLTLLHPTGRPPLQNHSPTLLHTRPPTYAPPSHTTPPTCGGTNICENSSSRSAALPPPSPKTERPGTQPIAVVSPAGRSG